MKIGRVSLLIAAIAVGIATASLIPGLFRGVRSIVGLGSPTSSSQPSGQAERERPAADTPKGSERAVRLTEDQISAAGIDIATVEPGTLARRFTVPGTIVPAGDRISRVSVKLSGTVVEMRRRLGDLVVKGEVLAILESREVADAKSEYLAARLTDELQQDLYERDKTLWDRRISTEQQFLRSRNLSAQTGMKLNIARQKLFALGLNESEIASLPRQPEESLRLQEVRSPMAGRIVERKVDLGTAVGRDNLETELFVIVDLSRVWIELAVSPSDLPAIREGQSVLISERKITSIAAGQIIFISPLIDKETRSARVVVEIANTNDAWRPGSFVTGKIAVDEQSVPLAVPLSAIQTISGETAVFVRTADGFQKRSIVQGRRDDRVTEVTTGLQLGENIAVTNTYLLKAELMKGLVED